MTDEKSKIKKELVSSIISGNCITLEKILDDSLSANFEYRNADFSFEPKPDINLLAFDNLTLLHIAAYADSFDCFLILHEKYKFPLNAQSAGSLLPIHYACKSSADEIAYYILEHDPEQAKQSSILLYTVQCGNSELLKCLLNHGASLNSNSADYQKVIEAALNNTNLECLKVLKQFFSNKNDYPISFACAQLNPERLPEFFQIDDLKISFSKKNSDPISLLYLLAQGGPKNAHIVKEILGKATNPGKRISLEPREKCEGVCHWACRFADLDVADLLFNFGTVDLYRGNRSNQLGPSVMASSSFLSEEQIITMLDYLYTKWEFNFCRPNPHKGPSVLETFVRAIQAKPKVVRALLFDFEANPRESSSLKTDNGKTLLEICTGPRCPHKKEYQQIFLDWAKDHPET